MSELYKTRTGWRVAVGRIFGSLVEKSARAWGDKNQKGPREKNLKQWGLSRNRKGAIVIENVPCDEVARKFGTPLHVISKAKLVSTLGRYARAFGNAYANTNILYAYKAGSVPGLLDVIHKNGIGAEVISGYELWLAVKLRVPPSAIVFNGPLKTSDDLMLAVQKEIFSINIDSLDDMRRIENVAREIGKTANVGVRLSLPGGYSNFGIPAEANQLFPIMDAVMASPFLKYRGLMTHLGGRSGDAGVYEKGIEIMAWAAKAIRHKYNCETEFFDVGGGLGVPTVRGYSLFENALYRRFDIPPKPPRTGECKPIERIAERTVCKLHETCKEKALPLPRLIVEPGRALVASPQVLLLTVHSVKRNWGRLMAITDGGRFNVNFPVEHEFHEMFLANREEVGPMMSYFLGGRISTAGDFVHRNKKLPELAVGDIIALMDSGAYFTQFSTNFSFPRPGVVLVEGNQSVELRRRETYEHLIAMDVFRGNE